MTTKRQLTIGGYKTAEDGLWTLASCYITKASQVQTFVSVPGRFSPLDLSTASTDGEPYYDNAYLEAVLESSEGTRGERQERITQLINRLDGYSVQIIHPDHPGRYLVGRVQITKEYNNLVHGAVRVSAICEPWLYNTEATVAEAILPYAELKQLGGMTMKSTEGLRSAPITEVESVGANLIPFPYKSSDKTENGVTWKVNEDGSVSVKGTPTKHSYFALSNNVDYGSETVNAVIKTASGNGKTFSGGVYWNSINKVLSLEVPISAEHVDKTFYPMINEGPTELPFRIYTRNTLPVPEAVQALDGYGEGINESVYNYIDWEKKQFVKRIGRVDMGTLAWTYDATNFRFRSNSLEGVVKSGSRETELLLDDYAVKSKHEDYDATWDKVAYIYGAQFYVHDLAYNADAAAFRAAMSGQMLYYELATPVITDISDILTDDNFISVEGGGTVTFKNEHEYAVPSIVSFTVDSDNKAVEDASVAYSKAVPGAAVQGPQEVNLTNNGRLAVVPTVTVTGTVTLTYGTVTRDLSEGTYYLPDLYLTPGVHTVLCSGKGMVTFAYREAVLAE